MTKKDQQKRDLIDLESEPRDHDIETTLSDADDVFAEEEPDQEADREEAPDQPLMAGPPSWFARTYEDSRPEDLASRYRARLEAAVAARQGETPPQIAPPTAAQENYRRRMEERFQRAKEIAEREHEEVSAFHQSGHEQPPVRKPVTRRAPDEGMQRFQEWDQKIQSRRQPPQPPQVDTPVPRRRKTGLAAAIAFACLAGGAFGYVSAHPDAFAELFETSAEKTQAALTAMLTSPEAPSAPVVEKKAVPAATVAMASNQTVLSKKPVKIAKVAVSDAIGALNDPIPLDLAAVPADPSQPIALKITGLPEDAYLTQGTEVAKGQWLVKSKDIDGVELVVPKSTEPQFDISVAAVEEQTGAPAAPAQALTVALELKDMTVVPASAPPEGTGKITLPEAVPVPMEVENSEARNLMDKGDALLKTGDLVAARQFYLRANDKGLAAAAFGVGRTYDPNLYQEMKVRGLEPDREKAAEWYKKAAEASVPEASEALAKLEDKQTLAQ